MRIIYDALGEAEGAVIGAWDANVDQWADTAAAITKRADEIAKA